MEHELNRPPGKAGLQGQGLNMNMSCEALTWFLILLACILLSFPQKLRASHPEDIEAEIEARKEEMGRHKSVLERLSAREREVYSQLAQTEDRLDKISDKLDQQEQRLVELQSREAGMLENYEKLTREREKSLKRVKGLISDLWPIYLESRAQGLAGMNEWAQMDRRISWLQAVHQEMNQALSLLREQSRELAANMEELRIARSDFEDQLKGVNSLKDQMLDKKLVFFRELQAIRVQKLTGQELVEEIMEVIESLNYKLKSAAPDLDIESFHGDLPWPVQGRIVEAYNPYSNPPHKGLSISLSGTDPVRAISWGKVVHNDTLRGFGRVVIIFHGDDYYSLYAYLSESRASIGQEVEQGEIIGTAGYYPQINSHGIYFELRFKQKPINPYQWLDKS